MNVFKEDTIVISTHSALIYRKATTANAVVASLEMALATVQTWTNALLETFVAVTAVLTLKAHTLANARLDTSGTQTL